MDSSRMTLNRAGNEPGAAHSKGRRTARTADRSHTYRLDRRDHRLARRLARQKQPLKLLTRARIQHFSQSLLKMPDQRADKLIARHRLLASRPTGFYAVLVT